MTLLIPKTFHRIWLGDAPMPDEFVAFGESWLRHHPGWEMVTWTDASLPPLIAQEAFDVTENVAARADIARYELLLIHGGVYLDTDLECLANIESLVDGLTLFGARESPERIGNAIFGATPGHPALRELIDAIPASIATQAVGDAATLTGPGLITRIWEPRLADAQATRMFAPELFYPYHYTELNRRHDDFPNAYGVHHWTGTWIKVRRSRAIWATDTLTSIETAAILRQYAALFQPDDLVELVIALPYEPTADDVAALRALAQQFSVNLESSARISLESLTEAARKGGDAAVTTDQSASRLTFQIAELVGWFARLGPVLETNLRKRFDHDPPALCDPGLLGHEIGPRLAALAARTTT